MISTAVKGSDPFFRVLEIDASGIKAKTLYVEGTFNCNGEGSIVLDQDAGRVNRIEGIIPGRYEFRIAIDQYRYFRCAGAKSGKFHISIWLNSAYHNPEFSQFASILDGRIMDIRVAVPRSAVSIDILTESSIKKIFARRSSQDTFDVVEFVMAGVAGYAFVIDGVRYPEEGFFHASSRVNSDGRTKIMYHIFPDRFYRSGQEVPGLSRWGTRPSRDSFFGGNLEGIREKIPYISDLGVDHIYLNPIFKSRSNHRYDVDDYYAVDDLLGGEADLKNLVQDSHANGIRIILDMVFNHTSTNFPAFRDVLKNGKSSRYYNWYIFHRDSFEAFNGRGKNGKFPAYETFMGYGGMPKLNHRNPEVRRYCLDVMKHYIYEFGVDGFRYDVAHSIYSEFFRETMQEIGKDKIHVCEAWCLPTYFLNGDSWISYTNYFLGGSIIDFIMEKITLDEFYDRIQRMILVNGLDKQQIMMNVLDSHDTPRILRILHGDKSKVKLAYTILYLFDGIATIYYGDEVGLDGGKDPDDRRCFPWDSIDEDMHDFFVNLGQIRKRFNLGSAGVIAISDDEISFKITKIKAEHSVSIYIARDDRMKFPDDALLKVKHNDQKTSPWDFYLVSSK